MGRIKNVMAVNRGEIATRIFRACTELGIRTTAIYSWEDRLAIHRYKADRAYVVGRKGEPVAAYLDGDAILALALKKGVDAIHPGYGFLSENADFAQRCIDAGVVWIGPPPAVMRALGDKVSARRVALEAGLTVVPGSDGPVSSIDEVRAFAATHGLPLLIKAAHGGGGRGMRIVREEGELEDAFHSAQHEAQAAFGNPEVFIERFIERARHIEVQLLGDQHGQRVHLFERDCSIQRRHQKLVEIAPAPNLPEPVRQQLYHDALRLADAVGYESAGTVEFLVEERDGAHHLYFIEVNTRIQVEHTITEMVTGHDLIKAMIRVAEGERLESPLIGIASQEALKLNGQAIQARITTEDPTNSFAPDSGKITTYRSAAGFGIRLDAGVGGAGSEILPHYDSMLVKVSAWGRDLADASQRLQRSLAEFRIRGVKTNIPFLQKVIAHPTFLAGQTTTRFVDQTPALLSYAPRRDRATKALSAIGDIVVNGPPGSGQKLTRPRPLIEPTPPPCPPGAAPMTPAYQVFKQRGAEGLSQWVRAHDKLLITDTTFRDAHQSLLATRVRTRDLLEIAPATAHAMPNVFSYEMWGGATFDVCMRFLHEDPWERLARMREAIPGALFQMLLRGANAVGYKNYPDNIVRAFIAESAQSGIDVFRVFDALNYLPNMEVAIDEILKHGKIVEASICYTGDVASPQETKYTLDYYVSLAEQLAAQGAHLINIKDMAGLLKPDAARLLVTALREATALPVHLHTHDTSGNGVAMYLEAARAGVDVVDCALSSMAGLTSQPSLNAIVAALEREPIAPAQELAALQPLSDHWELVRELYYPFESGLKASTTDVYRHEIPGGQYSNLRPRAIQLGLGERWELVRRTYQEVNRAMGNIVKVTPTSKVVADFAMFLVQNELTVDDLPKKHAAGEELDFPQSVVDFFMGYMGQPYQGFPPELQAIILRGQAPLTGRAGESMEDHDWEAQRAQVRELLGRDPKQRELISHALYPQVFSDFAMRINEFGEYRILDTVTFLYGVAIDEERLLDLEEGKTLVIKLLAISAPDTSGMRRLYYELNGQPREIVVRDLAVKLDDASRRRADKRDPSQLGAAMPGKILAIPVQPDEEVKRGQTLVVAEAMKMETKLTAPYDGVVREVLVRVGDQVSPGDLLLVIAPK